MQLGTIDYSYDKKRMILDKAELELDPERLNVVIGLNGSGKSTLFDVVAGALPADGFQPPFERTEILYQLQQAPLPPMLKGKDLVRLILKSDRTEPFRSLWDTYVASLREQERSRLERLQDLRLGQMSAGEKRWLVIRTVCHLDRTLYIFDEPTVGLDPESRRFVVEAIGALLDRQKIVLLSTHILHEVAHLPCKMHFLHHGKIVYSGSYHAFVARYETDNPDIAFERFLAEQQIS